MIFPRRHLPLGWNSGLDLDVLLLLLLLLLLLPAPPPPRHRPDPRLPPPPPPLLPALHVGGQHPEADHVHLLLLLLRTSSLRHHRHMGPRPGFHSLLWGICFFFCHDFKNRLILRSQKGMIAFNYIRLTSSFSNTPQGEQPNNRLDNLRQPHHSSSLLPGTGCQIFCNFLSDLLQEKNCCCVELF